MSVPDQYAFRIGASYALPHGAGLSLGARYEGVPVEDLIGGSNGFRRPGSVFSIEPGFSISIKDVSILASLPIAIDRNRPQSITDLETQSITGQFRRGDAAFADYLINLGIVYRLKSAPRPQRLVPDLTQSGSAVDVEQQ
jgi:hypothetical protein